MNNIDDLTLGWLAGMFEGEGTIFARGSATQVSINSTDKDIIERLHKVTGIGNVHFINYTKKNPEWKDQWRWLISRKDDSRDFLYAIYLLLGQRRRARIDDFRNWLDSSDQRFKEIQHGTYAGAQRCKPMCDDCRKADNAYQRERYALKIRTQS